MGQYPQPNTSAHIKPGRLWVSPTPSAQNTHQYDMRVHSLTTARLIQISNAVNNSFPINDTQLQKSDGSGSVMGDGFTLL